MVQRSQQPPFPAISTLNDLPQIKTEAIGTDVENVEEEEEEPSEVMEESSTTPQASLTIFNDHLTPQKSQSDSNITQLSKTIIDPDERYLMSCLPAFKRFTPQQKAYVRMGIEKLFYEVEFENISEPRNKKLKV